MPAACDIHRFVASMVSIRLPANPRRAGLTSTRAVPCHILPCLWSMNVSEAAMLEHAGTTHSQFSLKQLLHTIGLEGGRTCHPGALL